MFPTTTIVTKDRIYVPVPSELESAFKITAEQFSPASILLNKVDVM
jgi:hypothetical protein